MNEPLNPNYCADCRWWNYRCAAPAHEPCGNALSADVLRRTSHRAAEADAAAQYLETDRNMQEKELQRARTLDRLAGEFADGSAQALAAFGPLLRECRSGDYRDLVMPYGAARPDMLVTSPRVDSSGHIAVTLRPAGAPGGGTAGERPEADFVQGGECYCAELLRSIATAVLASTLRRQEEQKENEESAWRERMIRLAEERKKERL